MSTTRLVIRDALVARVASVTGLVVHTNLDYAVEDRNLPCAAVISGDDSVYDETSTLDTEGGSARFVVHLMVESSSDPESAADVHEALLRANLRSDMTLGGVAVNIRYTGGEWGFDLGTLAIRSLSFQAIF